jgi:hypothetical protein
VTSSENQTLAARLMNSPLSFPESRVIENIGKRWKI